MNGYEWLLGLAGRLLRVRYPERCEEIMATARATGRDAGRWARLAEVASLVALALRPPRPTRSARTTWLQGALLGASLAAIASLAHASPFVLGVPFVLLALGILDARLAAAATLFWLWRLATADLADVISALGDASLTLQLVRWLLMLIGLALAARVTVASIRRAASL
jgi:hypothetical protein